MKGVKGFQKGHKSFWTEETKKKMMGRKGYWTGKKRDDPEYIKKISLAHKGQHSSVATQFKKGHKSPRKGKHFPQVSGEKCHFWKGGITPTNKKIRTSLEYKLWRVAVFERDNYTCVWCKVRSGKGKTVTLHADHIKPFAHFPELRFAIDNGRTLCVECHRKTDTYCGKSNRY